jgi:hypothetical protein
MVLRDSLFKGLLSLLLQLELLVNSSVSMGVVMGFKALNLYCICFLQIIDIHLTRKTRLLDHQLHHMKAQKLL